MAVVWSVNGFSSTSVVNELGHVITFVTTFSNFEAVKHVTGR
jgi:hypothetical protein